MALVLIFSRNRNLFAQIIANTQSVIKYLWSNRQDKTIRLRTANNIGTPSL